MLRLVAIGCAVAAASARKVIKVGDTLPSVPLHDGFPPEKVDMGEFCKGKNMVLVGLPGAFTPT